MPVEKPGKAVKHIVKLGKAEVHLYPAQHYMGTDAYDRRPWENLGRVLEHVGKDVNAIAIEGMTTPEQRKKMKQVIQKNGKGDFFWKELVKKCVKNDASLVLIDSLTETLDGREYRDASSREYHHHFNKDLYTGVPISQKFPNKWLKRMNSNSYRDVVMTHNILKTIETQQKKDTFKIAVIAHPGHIKWIKHYLENPSEHQEIKKEFEKHFGNGFGKAKWAEMLLFKPRHLVTEEKHD
jgi:hypothetical protein